MIALLNPVDEFVKPTSIIARQMYPRHVPLHMPYWAPAVSWHHSNVTTIWECCTYSWEYCYAAKRVLLSPAVVTKFQVSRLDSTLMHNHHNCVDSKEPSYWIYHQTVQLSDLPTCVRCIWKHERFPILCCHLVYYWRYVSEKCNGLWYRNLRTEGLISWFSEWGKPINTETQLSDDRTKPIIALDYDKLTL